MARIIFSMERGVPAPWTPDENLIYFLETVTTDGITGYDTGDPYLSLFQDSFSCSFFLTTGIATYGGIGCNDKHDATSFSQFKIWVDNTFDKRITAQYDDGKSPSNSVTVEMAMSSWDAVTRTHFTVVINNSTRIAYIYKNKVDATDSQNFSAGVDMSAYHSSLNPFLGALNQWSGVSNEFAATFDHVRYYNIPLTPDQVTTVYDNDL